MENINNPSQTNAAAEASYDRARSLIHSFNAVIYLCDIYLYLRQLGLAGDIMFSGCSFVCMSFRKCLIRSHYQHREHGILKTN